MEKSPSWPRHLGRSSISSQAVFGGVLGLPPRTHRSKLLRHGALVRCSNAHLHRLTLRRETAKTGRRERGERMKEASKIPLLRYRNAALAWQPCWQRAFFENAFFENFANFWRARSWLYQNEILQENMRSTAFFKLYKICILLHRCNLKIFAKNRFEKTAIFVKFQ